MNQSGRLHMALQKISRKVLVEFQIKCSFSFLGIAASLQAYTYWLGWFSYVQLTNDIPNTYLTHPFKHFIKSEGSSVCKTG